MSVMPAVKRFSPKTLEFERLRKELAVALATEESPSVIRLLERRIRMSWESIEAAEGSTGSMDQSLCCLGE